MRPTQSYYWDERIAKPHSTTPDGNVPAYSALFHYEQHKQIKSNSNKKANKSSRSILKKCDYHIVLKTPQYLEHLKATHNEIQESLKAFNDETIAGHEFEITGDCGSG